MELKDFVPVKKITCITEGQAGIGARGAGGGSSPPPSEITAFPWDALGTWPEKPQVAVLAP